MAFTFGDIWMDRLKWPTLYISNRLISNRFGSVLIYVYVKLYY